MAEATSKCYCCVPHCKSNKQRQPYLSFHGFPSNTIEKNKWVQAIRRDEGQDFTILRGSTFVCSRHFSEADYTPATGRKRLKIGTVPGRFQWNNWGVSQRESVYDLATTRFGHDVRPDISLKECLCEDISEVVLTDHDYTASPTPGHELSVHHLLKMDQYGRYESSVQPEELFDHSLHWSEVKEEAEESQISAVSLGVETSQVCPKEDPDKQDTSFDKVSDIHGVTEQERGHESMTHLKVLPSPFPVKEESEECSLLKVDEEEVALITVKKEEPEDWLKSEDEDVVKVAVPCEPLETSSCSDTEDTEDSEMESDNVRDCENHERDVSRGARTKDCSRTSLDPGMAPDTDEKANAVDFSGFEGGSSFYPCPHCAIGFTIERFFLGHLKRDHPKDYIAMLKTGKIKAYKRGSLRVTPATCPQCGKSFTNKYVMQTHQRTHAGKKSHHCADCGKSFVYADALKRHRWTHTGETI